MHMPMDQGYRLWYSD